MRPDAKSLLNITCDVWRYISQQLTLVLHQDIKLNKVEEIAGGDINTSFKIGNNEATYFIKFINKKYTDMHLGEFTALTHIANTKTLRTPTPITTGTVDNYSFIVMEYLPITSHGNQFELGVKLAKMHQCVNASSLRPFGFATDNYIGTTPQLNTPKENWLRFWEQNRLQPQIKLALNNGYPKKLYSKSVKLIDNLPLFFNNYTPQASLLHGDLWGGNRGFIGDTPVIFDPASYYGDRETDIAMTELFGGFSADFYAGYNSVWTLDEGYSLRQPLYNLYHLLNHLNLFGNAYLKRCMSVLDHLLRHT